MKAYGEVDVWIDVYLTTALVRREWSVSRPGRFIPGTHWMGPRAGLNDVEK
jgi:hypothetical protein